MVKKSLTDKLRIGLYTGLAAGVLGLTGCGGSGNTEPTPPSKSLSQTAVLVNSVDIDYCAKLENVSSATRTTYRNGTEIDSLTITNPNYCETLEGLTKGNYKFDLTASNISSHSIEREVPNYAPEVDSSNSNLNLDMSPNSVLEVELTNPTDKNPEDNPVFYNSAESLEVNPILGGSSGQTTPLTIESYGSDLGNYQINLSFGNIGNGEGNEILEGRILDLPEKIAFWSNRPVPEGGYNEEIYTGDLINNQLTNIQRLTTDSGQDLEPTYSPDGSKIAFTSNRDRNIRIYTMNADGTNQTILTPGLDYAQQPAWSPDGSKITFRYREGDLAGIGLINLDGTGFTRIIEEEGGGRIPGSPSWSPDGSKIAFMTHRDGNWEIYTTNTDGSNQTNITNNPATDQLPRWSPDGNEIALVSDREGSLDIHKMSSDGSYVSRLTNDPGIEVDQAWSPDGSKMVFAHDIDFSNPQIYIMSSDGTGEWIQLTFDGSNRYPAFKPN